MKLASLRSGRDGRLIVVSRDLRQAVAADGIATTLQAALDDWEAWPARQQIDFLHRLENKISYYRALHDHTDLWVSLDGGAIDGDSVFPVALEMLP